MNIIDKVRKVSATRLGVTAVAIILVAAWYFSGAPIPGRYQIVVSGPQQPITMVNTMTGQIRVFSVSRTGSYHHLERGLEVIELTR